MHWTEARFVWAFSVAGGVVLSMLFGGGRLAVKREDRIADAAANR